MLQTLEVRTVAGTLLSMPLEEVSNGLFIENIDGLDPVKATVASSAFANMDGSQYQSSRREERNIKITIGLEPDYSADTVGALRNRIYDFFMPKSEVKLRFVHDDGLQVDIVGRVESCESTLFSRDPQMSISIICFDPDFLNLTPVTVTGNTTSGTTETTYTYSGNVETGLVFTMNVNRTLTAFTLYMKGPDGTTKSFDFAASLVNGDVVTISTVKGDKFVSLLRGGTTSSLLYGKTPQSTWLEFSKGDNKFRAYATGAAIPYSMTYVPRYGGL
jgi:hypothetical protein